MVIERSVTKNVGMGRLFIIMDFDPEFDYWAGGSFLIKDVVSWLKTKCAIGEVTAPFKMT